ncbi:Pentatricopeptide repeat [Dillenia turbinata]|uniref:Pentatricopeptide repeat n=1 Tax=Dillenia turbinata TaxID=194707 RepID=A0AAN8VEE6_9MAGN
MVVRKRDLASWSSLISCYSNNDMEFEAIVRFIDMIELGYCPNDEYFDSGVCVGCALIDMFVKGDCDLESAKKVFNKMPERNAVTWTLMITHYMQMGYASYALELFLDMVTCMQRAQGMFDGMSDHDVMSWTAMIPAVLKVCTYLSDLCLGEQVYSHAVKLGLALVNCVGNSLVSMYAQCGWMENAGKAFDVPFEKNLLSYNAIVDGYAKNLDSD